MPSDDDVATNQSRLVYPSAQAMYRAAERWRDEALIDDRSLFGGQNLEPQIAVQDLRRYFSDNPDMGPGTFVTKLHDQLRDTRPDAVQVAAELLYAHVLITSTSAMSSGKKAELITSVLAIEPDRTQPIPDDLREALRGGAAHPGTAFQTYRWKMFRYLIDVYAAVKALDVPARREALTSPDGFARLVAEIDEQTVWSQRSALEHLLFPDARPSILSRDDRARIQHAFGNAEETVEQISARLDPNIAFGAATEVDFYRFPYRDRWHGPNTAAQTYAAWASLVVDAIDLDTEERDYKIDGASRIRAAIQAALGEAQQSPAVIAELGKDLNLVDFRVMDAAKTWAAEAPEQMQTALIELTTHPGPESIDRFLSHVPFTGALAGLGGRLSLASTLLMAADPERWPPWRDRVVRTTRRLTDGYATQESASAGETYDIFLERLDVIRSAAAERGVRLRDALDAQGLAWTIAGDFSSPSWSPDVQRAYTEWKAGRSKSGPEAAEVQPEAPLGRGETEPSASVVAASIDDLADRLSLAIDDTPWLQETIELLLEKRQLILQGPPGTGKTFVAREIAWFLAGGRERVQLVQFHPGYSYEDFVAGLRPDPHEPTRFTVVPGPLLRMADRARQEPEERFVLIIDELNRGNVPAVFGELYFLLEYRDEHATLTYGGPPFSLPPNLFFIATMNTADRSITSLDAALRRRFYVRDLEPGAPPLDGIMRRYLAERAPAFAWLADLVDQANEVIGDRDQAIGPSHFLRPDISEVSARRAWEHAVIPTLRELFWSQPARLEPLQFDALKAKVTQTSADTAPD